MYRYYMDKEVGQQDRQPQTRECIFNRSLQQLRLQLDEMNQRTAEMLSRNQPENAPCYNQVPMPSPPNTVQLPSGPAFWQLYRSLRNDIHNLEVRTENMEDNIEHISNRLDAIELLEFTPPESLSSDTRDHAAEANTSETFTCSADDQPGFPKPSLQNEVQTAACEGGCIKAISDLRQKLNQNHQKSSDEPEAMSKEEEELQSENRKLEQDIAQLELALDKAAEDCEKRQSKLSQAQPSDCHKYQHETSLERSKFLHEEPSEVGIFDHSLKNDVDQHGATSDVLTFIAKLKRAARTKRIVQVEPLLRGTALRLYRLGYHPDGSNFYDLGDGDLDLDSFGAALMAMFKPSPSCLQTKRYTASDLRDGRLLVEDYALSILELARYSDDYGTPDFMESTFETILRGIDILVQPYQKRACDGSLPKFLIYLRGLESALKQRSEPSTKSLFSATVLDKRNLVASDDWLGRDGCKGNATGKANVPLSQQPFVNRMNAKELSGTHGKFVPFWARPHRSGAEEEDSAGRFSVPDGKPFWARPRKSGSEEEDSARSSVPGGVPFWARPRRSGAEEEHSAGRFPAPDGQSQPAMLKQKRKAEDQQPYMCPAVEGDTEAGCVGKEENNEPHGDIGITLQTHADKPRAPLNFPPFPVRNRCQWMPVPVPMSGEEDHDGQDSWYSWCQYCGKGLSKDHHHFCEVAKRVISKPGSLPVGLSN